MLSCPVCLSEVSLEARSCPKCGSRLEYSVLETSPPILPPPSTDPLDGARFVPGTLLAGRYRIVGLVGRGGMGEVYKAEDLKLGQQVALKFLPERFSRDPATLSRFHREVRTARQIAHPNVCRVFDIGEVDGQHFISMEYIDGEDLATLIRRIGHLPSHKAMEIARQLCAGLAAAHDSNVLHRDLKPGNIMLDGRGKVRITDFGLAGLVSDFQTKDIHAGTPGYMAPEQLTGKEVSMKSDLYSLGLVLYEVFTGKRVHEATSLAELLRKHETSSPTRPSVLIKDIDPIAEAVILRCLEKNPENRPASALQVAAALPGGDPLAAALAAGETPSPEMVAAAPKQGALRPAIAIICFAGLLMLLTFIMAADSAKLYRKIPLIKSPEILAERALNITQELGYKNQPLDTAYAFDYDERYVRYARKQDAFNNSAETLAAGQPLVFYFWHRQSPGYFSAVNELRISERNPSVSQPGMVNVALDVRGRLVRLEAVPPRVDDEKKTEAMKTDWNTVFQTAGLEISRFRPDISKWNPPVYADERFAWQGTYADHPAIPIRIEGAAYRGRPIYFEVIPPWQNDTAEEGLSTRSLTAVTLILISFVLVLIGALLLARRNLRLGRGDRKGALRLALFVFIMIFAGALIGSDHAPSLSTELSLLVQTAEKALLISFLLWLMYIALEPYIRRQWPDLIISWNRLLAGAYRDPMVGRDILVGGLLGVAHVSTIYMANLPILSGNDPDLVGLGVGPSKLRAFRYLVSTFQMTTIPEAIVLGFLYLFLFLLLFAVLRRRSLAVAALWLLNLTVLGLFFATFKPAMVLAVVIIPTIVIVTLVRFGLLAMIANQLFFYLSFDFPLTYDVSVWYGRSTLFALTILLVLGTYGFYVSLGGQPLFRSTLLHD